jgi:hypothetical protein
MSEVPAAVGPYSPLCAFCRHVWREQAPDIYACDAFPFGIPDEILDGVADHRKPVEGDHGIRFENDGHFPAVGSKLDDD